SSRRRHTRFSRDWSSDVCSSDLGEVDAFINPHPPEAVMTPGGGIERLFPDWSETTRAYFRRHGYFPIMHVLAVKAERLMRRPEQIGRASCRESVTDWGGGGRVEE